MQVLAAPRDVKVLAGTVRKEGDWHIMSQGSCVSGFMGSFGPPEITMYNWKRYRTPENDSDFFSIQHQNEPSGLSKYKSHSLDDIVTLTKEGDRLRRAFPDKVLYMLEVVCAGEGNCTRVCGATGPGPCGCSEAKHKKHSCSAAVQICRTAQDIFDGNVRITFLHQHVAPPTVPQPPDAHALRPDASIVRQIVHSMTQGGITAQKARSTQRATLSAGDVPNSRYDPSKVCLESKAKYGRRLENRSVGDEMSGWNDWQKANNFVLTVLVQRRIVLHYEPLPGTDGIVVLAPSWALELLRVYGGKLIGTDAKNDTTQHCKSKFSSIRCQTPKGSVGCVVWIAEGEDGGTLKTAFDAVARNIPCGSSECEHKAVEKWVTLPSGKKMYMRAVACGSPQPFDRNPDYNPYVVHDKHVPTFNAVSQSFFFHP